MDKTENWFMQYWYKKKKKQNKNPPDNKIKQSMRGEGANKTVKPCHFLLKRLYQAKKVYGHVYVYYGFPCLWASVN